MAFIFKDLDTWRHKIERVIEISPLNAKRIRFVVDSFAPLRQGNKVRLMIDGEMYFRNLA